MKLPYNESYCFCLENMDDVKLFGEYIYPDLSLNIWDPLGYIRRMGVPLPQYVNVIQLRIDTAVSWHHESKVPYDKTLIPLDALFHAEKYPELLI